MLINGRLFQANFPYKVCDRNSVSTANALKFQTLKMIIIFSIRSFRNFVSEKNVGVQWLSGRVLDSR